MERLTEKGTTYATNDGEHDIIVKFSADYYEEPIYDLDSVCAKLNRLAELEDKLESGQLVEFPRVRLLAEEGDDKLFNVEWLDKESGDIRSCFCLSEKVLKQTLKELQEKL